MIILTFKHSQNHEKSFPVNTLAGHKFYIMHIYFVRIGNVVFPLCIEQNIASFCFSVFFLLFGCKVRCPSKFYAWKAENAERIENSSVFARCATEKQKITRFWQCCVSHVFQNLVFFCFSVFPQHMCCIYTEKHKVLEQLRSKTLPQLCVFLFFRSASILNITILGIFCFLCFSFLT